MTHRLAKRLVAEGIGTAILLAAVVGSGIMGERLAAGNVALALLANSIATGCALAALILTFGPISGAHFNPAVTLAAASLRSIPWREVPPYFLAQIVGAVAGTGIANLMFGLPLFFVARHTRSGRALILSEVVATFGLIAVILGCRRLQPLAMSFAVATYITAAYWFTASTSFANPAVTLARSLSDTFAGISPLDVPAFVIAQLVGTGAAAALFCWFQQRESEMSNQKRILILCTGNSARSQMAEGLLRQMAGDRFAAESAGVAPTQVRPEAIAVMREIGIDISDQHSKSVEEFLGQQFAYVITVCDNANEQCPNFPAETTRLHWSFADPAAVSGDEIARLAEFRRIRDEIAEQLRIFLQDLRSC